MFNISFTKVSTWRQCKQRAYYQYVLYIKKKVKTAPLIKGIVIQDACEAYHQGKNYKKIIRKFEKQFDKLMLEEKNMLGDLPTHIKNIMENYVEQVKPFKVISSEHEIKFEYKYKDEIFVLHAFIDSIIKRNGKYLMLERKAKNDLPTTYVNDIYVQAYLYYWLLKKTYDKKISLIIFDLVRAKNLCKPELLKNGTLSKNKSIDTTWNFYKQSIKENNLNVKDYLDVKEKLLQKEGTYLRQDEIKPDKKIMKEIVDDFFYDAYDMAKNLGKVKTKNISFQCKFCDYKDLCEQELLGLDTSHILKEKYTNARN